VEVQELTVVIARDGSVKLEVRGVKGAKCLDLTQSLEKVLGGDVKSRELSPEHGQAAQAQVAASVSVKPRR
jgi:hypothetical protein